MAADVVWPSDILPPTGGRVSIVSATIGGGRSMSGLEQVVASDAGYLALKMTVPVQTDEQVRAWNGLEAVLGGRSGTCLVPALDRDRAPWPLVAGLPIFTRAPRTTISNAVAGIPAAGQQTIEAYAEGDFDAGAVEVSLRVVIGSALLPGHQFSAGERLFRIGRIIDQTVDGSDVIYNARVALPVRQAIADGTRLNFDDPYFRAVLASDSEMSGLDLDLLRFGSASINWTEDL